MEVGQVVYSVFTSIYGPKLNKYEYLGKYIEGCEETCILIDENGCRCEKSKNDISTSIKEAYNIEKQKLIIQKREIAEQLFVLERKISKIDNSLDMLEKEIAKCQTS